MRLFWAKNEALIPGYPGFPLYKPGFLPNPSEIAWVIPRGSVPGYPGVYPIQFPSLVSIVQLRKCVLLFPEFDPWSENTQFEAFGSLHLCLTALFPWNSIDIAMIMEYNNQGARLLAIFFCLEALGSVFAKSCWKKHRRKIVIPNGWRVEYPFNKYKSSG